VLYARVSTDEQARSGYSLSQQIEALREYAAHEGYEVIEEVQDPAQSGASLERPGMDRVRDLVAGGGVSVVLAQDRDRFAREPAYLFYLREEFAEHGTALRALNDRGDDSPEGRLTDGILDEIARFERLKIAERSRRGKLRKAREGKIIAPRRPRYGFRLNAARDAYEVYEPEMEVVRRIFQMVGAEGRSPGSLARVMERQGVPTPGGGRYWDRTFFRECVLADVYKPHTFDEVRAVLSAGAASRLDPDKLYGLWWFNRRGVKTGQISEMTPEGRRYRKTYHWHEKPKEEWIAVAVPDSGVPRELVEAAKAVVEKSRKPAHAGRRFWQLTGGVAYCGECGGTMGASHSTKTDKGRSYSYDYYCCTHRSKHGTDACANAHRPRACDLEEPVWDLVSGLLKDPGRLRAGLERLIEEERRSTRDDPNKEAQTWAKKLAEVDRKRGAYQDQQAEGLITLDELRGKLAALEERRSVALAELESIRGRREYMERLENDAAALLEHYAGTVPEALDGLDPEERHSIYRMLRLKVVVCADGRVELTGVFGGPLEAGPTHSVETGVMWSATPTPTTSGASLTSSTLFGWRGSTCRGTPTTR
jgi:site-specific DNA recombinase